MKRLPDWSSLDVVVCQSEPYFLTGGTKFFGIDGDTGQPLVRLTIGSKRHKLNAVRITEHSVVAFEIVAPRCDAFL